MIGRRGVTLVEVMIVVAVIALLAAISIPSLLRARLNANESAAISSIRSISTAMEGYKISHTTYTGATLNGLAIEFPPYVDPVLGTGSKQGYDFTITVDSGYQYWAQGVPQNPGSTGRRNFYIDEQGVICAGDAATGAHALGNSCPNGFNPI